MTMSVGLARITPDPNASVLIRKMMGALSTPGLLVYDTGLSIDDTGRIIVKLNPDGGIVQDENGLALAPVQVKIGIDSEVQLDSKSYDRDWNARLTGSAPNFIEGSVAIGSEELAGISDAFTAANTSVEPAKVNITATTTQLRLSYDNRNFVGTRVWPSGYTESFCLGTRPGYHFVTGDEWITPGSWPRNGGFRINGGSEIQRIRDVTGNLAYPGGTGAIGAISYYEQSFVTDAILEIDPNLDHVTVSPMDAIPANVLGWSARISAANTLSVRVAYFDEMFPHNVRWRFLVHQLTAGI